jgi:pyruvate/2-oxoglutarate dehydrogenase complex dihydrolipoamide dehydrogenase (E3) component
MTHVEPLDLDRLPEHLVVIGGGYAGLELAQAMRRFGSRVTVIEQGPQLAGGEDPDVAAAVHDLLGDEGIDVRPRTRVRGVKGTSGREVYVLTEGPDGDGSVTGTDLLVAVGRTPNTGGTGLEKAGVQRTEAGYIKVDEHLATTADRVRAMGECAGSPQFTHVAFDDFRVVRDQLNGAPAPPPAAWCRSACSLTRSWPGVGCNETEAGRRGIRYRLLRLPMAAVLRTRTLSQPRGFLKMLIAADSDEILGFTAFGAEASELMAAVRDTCASTRSRGRWASTWLMRPIRKAGSG